MGQCKSALRTLYLGFRKAKLKRTWDSASLSTEALRVMLMQFLDAAAVVCKSEHRGFKKAKKNVGQCKSEGQDFKERLKKTWDSESLRKVMLKNRKEARF
jgi:hypothetical protein